LVGSSIVSIDGRNYDDWGATVTITRATGRAATIRRELGYPVIDGDGHMIEHLPPMLDHIRPHLTAAQFDLVLQNTLGGNPAARDIEGDLAYPTFEERRAMGRHQYAWWGLSTNALDRATVMLPALLAERMDEIGIDHEVLYPTIAFGTGQIHDAEIRNGVVRGTNDFYAEVFGPYKDRITVPGIVTMETPEEAVDHLRYCRDLGFKAALIPHGVVRMLEEPAANHQDGYMRTFNHTVWFDTYGIDSPYDYDPVWAMFMECGYAVTCHQGLSTYVPERHFFSNYVANHIGTHAGSMARMAKSIYLGGVTRRFPNLAFAFLECGVSWGAQMLADMVEHWEKRNAEAIQTLDPARLDLGRMADLFVKYGRDLVADDATHDQIVQDLARGLDGQRVAPEDWDNFAALKAESKDEVVALFVDNFFFGCEADDKMVNTAFNPGLPQGSKLNAFLSSDIAHWDVADFGDVLPEAYEMLENGLLTAEQFRGFVFEHGARLYTKNNPRFFDGTTIETEVRELLG
jgi:predicted TIM-barrel fold metal-dependent hydrolase